MLYLTELAIGYGNHAVCANAFSTGKLKSVKIEEGVKYIGTNAFWMNSLLNLEINLPNSIKHTVGRIMFSVSEVRLIYKGEKLGSSNDIRYFNKEHNL